MYRFSNLVILSFSAISCAICLSSSSNNLSLTHPAIKAPTIAPAIVPTIGATEPEAPPTTAPVVIRVNSETPVLTAIFEVVTLLSMLFH